MGLTSRPVRSVPDRSNRATSRSATPRFEVEISTEDAGWRGEGPAVRVRCGDCGHRLLDVEAGYRDLGTRLIPDDSLKLERRCPWCGRFQEGWVPAEPGRRLATKEALAGAWRCDCDRSLGFVDGDFGRIVVTCRCGVETRVVAAKAIAEAEAGERSEQTR